MDPGLGFAPRTLSWAVVTAGDGLTASSLAHLCAHAFARLPAYMPIYLCKNIAKRLHAISCCLHSYIAHIHVPRTVGVLA